MRVTETAHWLEWQDWREPMKDVMRVDRGDRRDVILLADANGDVGGRQSSASQLQRTSLPARDPESLATALSTRVSFHAKGNVNRTTAAFWSR